MHTIQLEIPDELAEQLVPYEDQLPELLELGLKEFLERQEEERRVSREEIDRVLAASGMVTLPQPDMGEIPYIRQTPVPITGKPASEIVIEQRGPR